jgi:DNA-binding NtrC family response regulator
MRILLVDDDRASRAAVNWFLKDLGHTVTECANGEEALTKYTADDFPLVLSDIKMPGMSGIELLASIKKLSESWRTDVVLFTGWANTQSAIAALREGAYDYLSKPIEAKELAIVVDRVVEHQNLLRKNEVLNKRLCNEVNTVTGETKRESLQIRSSVLESPIGKIGIFSPALGSALDLAIKFHYDRSIPVLIQGETGTGKEIVAKTIHFGDSPDKTAGPFVGINCAAIVPSLFESELFGYEAGAFTGGATKGQMGKLDIAAGGTLFLDEVGEIPLELQGKLLRVLEEKEYYRVGGPRVIATDVRIICASNNLLEQRVAEGSFRKDLYYRLKIGCIRLLPLRERREEILPLAAMFLREFALQKHKRFMDITPEAGKLLYEYDWPGNVRELKNAMEFIVFMYDDVELKPMHIGKILNTEENDSSFVTPEKQILLPFPEDGYSLKCYSDDIVSAVLGFHDGNQVATARYLGISIRALAYRLTQMKTRKRVLT